MAGCNPPKSRFFLDFFWDFSGSRKVAGTDDFDLGFGFTGLPEDPTDRPADRSRMMTPLAIASASPDQFG
jgi:hypothetical protein